jgi:hypothetical protein
LPSQYEAAGPRARELDEASCGKLATTPLWISEGTNLLRQVGRLDRSLAMVRLPRFEQLHDPTPLGIVSLDHLDPLNGIATTEREQRIAAPGAPLLEAA